MPPRRLGKACLAADGLRAYMTCKCAKGCGLTLYVLEESFSKNRKTAIDDHLAECTSIPVEERPAKKARGFSAKQLIQGDSTGIVPNLHTGCQKSIAALKQNMDEINGRLSSTEDRLGVTESRLNMYDAALTVVLPGIDLPLTLGRAETQLRLALPNQLEHEVDVHMLQRDASRNKSIAEREAREKEALRSAVSRLKNGTELQRANAMVKRAVGENVAMDLAFARIDTLLQTVGLEKSVLDSLHEITNDMRVTRYHCAKRARLEMS